MACVQFFLPYLDGFGCQLLLLCLRVCLFVEPSEVVNWAGVCGFIVVQMLHQAVEDSPLHDAALATADNAILLDSPRERRHKKTFVHESTYWVLTNTVTL